MYKIGEIRAQKICAGIGYLAGMKWSGFLLSCLACIATVVVTFVAASLVDVAAAVLYSRFYSTITFIVVFGVAGIFAAALGFTYGISYARPKNTTSRWVLIVLLLLLGLLCFFVLAKLEGGEYEAAFKAYGATMGLTSFLFSGGKLD